FGPTRDSKSLLRFLPVILYLWSFSGAEHDHRYKITGREGCGQCGKVHLGEDHSETQPVRATARRSQVRPGRMPASRSCSPSSVPPPERLRRNVRAALPVLRARLSTPPPNGDPSRLPHPPAAHTDAAHAPRARTSSSTVSGGNERSEFPSTPDQSAPDQAGPPRTR